MWLSRKNISSDNVGMLGSEVSPVFHDMNLLTKPKQRVEYCHTGVLIRLHNYRTVVVNSVK